MYDADAKEIERRLKGYELNAWGKMQQTSDTAGLDMITGHAFMPDTETPRRNATFVKYVSEWDRSVPGRPKYDAEGVFAYGRVEYFLVLDAQTIADIIGGAEEDNGEDIDEDDPHARTLALAVISPIPSFKRLRDCNLVTYKSSSENALGQLRLSTMSCASSVVCKTTRVAGTSSIARVWLVEWISSMLWWTQTSARPS